MSRIVIQTITVECVNQTSNKFYEVVLAVYGDKLVLETSYGAINSKPKQGKGGSFVVPDVASSAGSQQFETRVASLVHEANTILQSKFKKDYAGRQTSFDPTVVLGRIYNHFPTNAEHKAASATKSSAQTKGQVLDSIEVEVIGFDASKVKIAKVLEDFNYEVLGLIEKPANSSHRIGDVISVVKTGDGYKLA